MHATTLLFWLIFETIDLPTCTALLGSSLFSALAAKRYSRRSPSATTRQSTYCREQGRISLCLA
jgi:positive regulator of sigma E activity